MSMQTEPIINNTSQVDSHHGGEGQQDYEYQSVWMSKKVNQQRSKDVDLLQNRILLLRKEEERTQKKIFETESKANNILQNKKRNEEIYKKKQTNAKHDEEFLTLMQKQSCGLRKSQKNERAAIRMALQDLKREEANEIKRASKAHQEVIKQSQEMQNMEKKRKHDAVHNIVQNARMNVQTYWSEKLRFFGNQNEITKMEMNRSKSQKEFVLSRLEQEELELIKRLQFSQDRHQQACHQLDNVIQLPASEFEDKFGNSLVTPQAKKKDPLHKKNQSQNSFQKSSFTNQPKKKQYKPTKISAVTSNKQQQQQQQHDHNHEEDQQQQYQQQENQDQEQTTNNNNNDDETNNNQEQAADKQQEDSHEHKDQNNE